eukprot:5455252-Prymnesium_polylepis.1
MHRPPPAAGRGQTPFAPNCGSSAPSPGRGGPARVRPNARTLLVAIDRAIARVAARGFLAAPDATLPPGTHLGRRDAFRHVFDAAFALQAAHSAGLIGVPAVDANGQGGERIPRRGAIARRQHVVAREPLGGGVDVAPPALAVGQWTDACRLPGVDSGLAALEVPEKRRSRAGPVGKHPAAVGLERLELGLLLRREPAGGRPRSARLDVHILDHDRAEERRGARTVDGGCAHGDAAAHRVAYQHGAVVDAVIARRRDDVLRERPRTEGLRISERRLAVPSQVQRDRWIAGCEGVVKCEAS